MRELDGMNLTMTFLVMFIHISSQAVSSLDKFSAPHIAVFAFWRLAMISIQGFVFLSGVKFMLSFRTRKLNYPKYALSRFVKIIVPYVVFNVIYYVNFVQNGYFGFSLRDLGKYLIRGDLAAPFYFVIVIAQFYLLAPLWTRIFNKMPAAVTMKAIIPAAAAVNILWVTLLPYIMRNHFPAVDAVPISRLLFGNILYWTAGCAVGKNYENFLAEIKKHKAAIFALTAVTAAMFVPYSYFHSYSQMKAGADLLNSISAIMHMILCVCSIPSLMIISDALSTKWRKICESKAFSLLSASTYYIYLIHCLFIFYAEKIGRDFQITRIFSMFVLKSVFVGILSVASSMAIVFLTGVVKRIIQSSQSKPDKPSN